MQRVCMRRNLTTRAEPEWLNVQASKRFAQSDILDDEQQECIDYFHSDMILTLYLSENRRAIFKRVRM